MNQRRIAITCGDPAGVGPEIIERWAADHSCQGKRVTVIGPRRWLARCDAFARFSRVEVGAPEFEAVPGEPSVEGAKIAMEALEAAAAQCARGEADAVVTAPVSKIWLRKAGFPFPGHTEFFAARWGGEPVMAFAGRRLRIALATWHIPLADVVRVLDANRIQRAITAAAELVRLCDGKEEPRIGVCGLNPHAGENGMLGTEERDWIDPLLESLRETYPNLSRTQPADTIFWRAIRGEFDAVVALYHDQGLGPLKTVEFEEAVNVTLGLPYLRTSPDHGTAFAVAGRGIADIRSFARAAELALGGGEGRGTSID